MSVFVLGLTSLFDKLQTIKRSVKYVAFADYLKGVGKLIDIKIWWEALKMTGPKYSCYLKVSKSFLIIKREYYKYIYYKLPKKFFKKTRSKSQHKLWKNKGFH